MKFILIHIRETNGKNVSGNFIQGHVGTVESAKRLADDTNAVNGGRLNIAVIRETSPWHAPGDFIFNQERIA